MILLLILEKPIEKKLPSEVEAGILGHLGSQGYVGAMRGLWGGVLVKDYVRCAFEILPENNLSRRFGGLNKYACLVRTLRRFREKVGLMYRVNQG